MKASAAPIRTCRYCGRTGQRDFVCLESLSRPPLKYICRHRNACIRRRADGTRLTVEREDLLRGDDD